MAEETKFELLLFLLSAPHISSGGAFIQYIYSKALDRPTPSRRKPFSLLPSSPDTWFSCLPIPPSLPSSPYLFGVLHYYRTSSLSRASRTVSDPSGTSSQTSIPQPRSLQYATD
ncbi:MAG: hypothetical protein Q9175_003740 [Cornicularia normoerica]